jgi:hypothetical protein
VSSARLQLVTDTSSTQICQLLAGRKKCIMKNHIIFIPDKNKQIGDNVIKEKRASYYPKI